jgi:hypothetical protein
MIAMKGTVKNGQVVLDDPAGLSDGTRVDVVPVGVRPTQCEDEDGPMTPEEIADVLGVMARIEPLLMTPAEEAQWKADLAAQRDHDAAAFAARAERLRRMWE